MIPRNRAELMVVVVLVAALWMFDFPGADPRAVTVTRWVLTGYLGLVTGVLAILAYLNCRDNDQEKTKCYPP